MTEITIDLSDEFIAEIDQFVETSKLCYDDREEFIREAIRTHHRKMKN